MKTRQYLLYVAVIALAMLLCACNPVPPATETTDPANLEATLEPTADPTKESSEEPTPGSTEEPTEGPTVEPTEEPTEAPTEEPTEEPTQEPTETPTDPPATQKPTDPPVTDPPATQKPTEKPTEPPATQKPTEAPTDPPATQKPTEPPVTDPPAAEPPTDPPTEPPTEAEKPKIDVAAIAAYGNSYAQTLGFIVDTSMGKNNAGYYPPDYQPLFSPEDGYATIVACVAATAHELNAFHSNGEYAGEVLCEQAQGYRINCIIEYSHTDEIGDWYITYILYG